MLTMRTVGDLDAILQHELAQINSQVKRDVLARVQVALEAAHELTPVHTGYGLVNWTVVAAGAVPTLLRLPIAEPSDPGVTHLSPIGGEPRRAAQDPLLSLADQEAEQLVLADPFRLFTVANYVDYATELDVSARALDNSGGIIVGIEQIMAAKFSGAVLTSSEDDELPF